MNTVENLRLRSPSLYGNEKGDSVSSDRAASQEPEAVVAEPALADVIDALNVFNGGEWDKLDCIAVGALPKFIQNVVSAWYGPDARAMAHLVEPALLALRYYRDHCTGAEPSISVFHKMLDEALGGQP